MQEKKFPVVNSGHSSLIAGLLQLAGLGFVAVLAAPHDAEGWIAQHAVEAVFGLGPLVARFFAVRVMRDERVAEKDFCLPIVLDEQVGLTDGVVRGGKFLPVDGDEFLDVVSLCGCRGPVQQVFLGDGQHAARAAGGVVDGEMPVGNGNVQQLDHETDDFARGEVISGLLAALFREPPEQFLIDITHLQRRELVRTEFQFLVLVQDRSEPVVLHHRADGGSVVEVLDDIVNVLRKAVDVGAEIFLQQGMIFLVDLAERPGGLVREWRLLGIKFEFLDQLGKFLFSELGTFGEHLRALLLPPRDQHALQPADDNDRQDNVLVFVGLELAAQPLGRFPNVASEVIQLGFVERESHLSTILVPKDTPFPLGNHPDFQRIVVRPS
ncbi:MAG: hypothetical protein EWM72_02254 [Nitrospira sp.]|nr:MAG: hypothetical protein EWM72_02254 [Nitrospira sp.]